MAREESLAGHRRENAVGRHHRHHRHRFGVRHRARPELSAAQLHPAAPGRLAKPDRPVGGDDADRLHRFVAADPGAGAPVRRRQNGAELRCPVGDAARADRLDPGSVCLVPAALPDRRDDQPALRAERDLDDRAGAAGPARPHHGRLHVDHFGGLRGRTAMPARRRLVWLAAVPGRHRRPSWCAAPAWLASSSNCPGSTMPGTGFPCWASCRWRGCCCSRWWSPPGSSRAFWRCCRSTAPTTA